MLLAEQLFSKAEAEDRGLLTGDAKADYLAGIQASFETTFRNAPAPTNPNKLVNGGDIDPKSNYDKYLAANASNGLADWEATNTPATDANGVITTGTRTVSKQEKILTQKWLAESVFSGIDAWDGFRRTGFPAVPLSVQAFTGKFPARLLYPQSEINTNKANVDLTKTQFDKIFWQP
ncbi:MAG: SusD/RagB family nutrient-binding outer membrane lipoprotein [Hymenobacter sp.]